jgi:H+/Cl- antiporter ClcA
VAVDPTQTPPSPPPGREDRSVSELIFDVSERASSLVREEIELAKAEVSEKVGKILRGSAVGIAAGTFAFLALILIMHGVAWLLAEELFDGNVWPGYFVEAALFLLVAAAAGLFAYRSLQAGAPPVPEQAIEEAKQIKSTLEGQTDVQAVQVATADTPTEEAPK